MFNWLSKMICLLVLAACLVIGGCAQRYRETTQPTEDIVIGPNIVIPDYASRAIEATGGLDRWTKTKKIEMEAVITFYKPDGSYYLTQQHHEIHPLSNSVLISAVEPQGNFTWQLSNGDLIALEGSTKLKSLPVKLCQRHFSEALLNIITAPIRLLDSEVLFTERPDPVKKEGLWYYAIDRARPYDSDTLTDRYWSKAIFYLNKKNSLVNLLWFVPGEDAMTEQVGFVATRGYDYRRIEEDGVLVPTKIEIFNTDAKGTLQQRTIKIDYFSLKFAEKTSSIVTED